MLLAATTGRAGTLDDMGLRSNVETSIRGTADTAMLHLKIEVKDGVVTPIGLVHDLDQADRVVLLATKIKGVKDVDRSKLQLEFAGPPDDQLASQLAREIMAVPKFAASSPRIAVAAGVVTLTGSLKNAAWRGELRTLCGAVQGVIDVVDELETPVTPDDKIQRVLDGNFGPRVLPPFPGRVDAKVKDGVVTLEGRVPRLYDKRAAEERSRSINGVRRIDNQLELGSGTTIEVIHP